MDQIERTEPPDDREPPCSHPSWNSAKQAGKVRCALCGILGTELRYLQPDDQPSRIGQRSESAQPVQIIDPPGAAVEMFRRKHGRLPNRDGDQLSLPDRLELAAQACHAAHLLSCETTCQDAIAALSMVTPSEEMLKLAQDRLKTSTGLPSACECEGCLLAREIVRLAGRKGG